MSLVIAEGLETNKSSIVEAGTGTGKSFAELVPTIAEIARYNKFNPGKKKKLKVSKKKPYWSGKIEKLTKDNKNYRNAIYTGNQQLVLMSLNPGEEIGSEVHDKEDQFFRIEKGSADFVLGKKNKKVKVKEDEALIVPAGLKHNVVNSGDVPVKLYSVYSPAHHPEGTVHKTKADDDHEH